VIAARGVREFWGGAQVYPVAGSDPVEDEAIVSPLYKRIGE
jgi:hypothetical protein